MKTEEQRLLDDLYNRDERVSNKLPKVDPNKVAKLQEGVEIRSSINYTGNVEVNGQKIPDPKKHQIISFIKSGIRLAACFIGIMGFYELGFFGLFAAEIVGIYEELV